jgi:hypothetical protein
VNFCVTLKSPEDEKNLWNLCDKKKGGDYEEAKDHRAGGEGSSSRAHGIADGTGNHQLHGTRTILKIEKPALAVFAAGAGYFTTLHVGLICM